MTRIRSGHSTDRTDLDQQNENVNNTFRENVWEALNVERTFEKRSTHIPAKPGYAFERFLNVFSPFNVSQTFARNVLLTFVQRVYFFDRDRFCL